MEFDKLIKRFIVQLMDLENDVSSYLSLSGIFKETKLNVTSFVRKLENLKETFNIIISYEYPPKHELSKLYKELNEAIRDINRYGKIYDELIARKDSNKENNAIVDALINYQMTLFHLKDESEELLKEEN